MKGHRSTRASAPTLIEILESRTLLAATKIMPLGDSITESATGHASYRYWLWNSLQQGGYDVDFVGSRTGVSGGSPLYPNFDQNHEGHSGYRADQIQTSVSAWANTYRPDIVLLHIGTNDIFYNQSNSSTINEISAIIDNLRNYVPGVTVLLAKIIPNNANASATQQLNNSIGTLAAQKDTASSRVIAVDQYSGFDLNQDTYDGLHPDESGEQKMAAKWYAALQGVLGQQPPPPPPPPPAGTVYLSDLNWTSMSNGWGPVEKNRSNGEQGATDGRTITLNGTTYAKGLGTHAGSDVRYNLSGGNYTEFRADIGVDDEVGNNGTVVFQVWLDNALKYDSGRMTGSTATKSIIVPLSGGGTLRLVALNNGDGADFDHADWADARLIAGEPTPVPAAPTALAALHNSVTGKIDLTWTDASSDEKGFRIERKTGAGGVWSPLVELDPNTQSYSDGNIAEGNTYYYRIYAFNLGGSSGYSNEANEAVPVPPPPPPPAGTVHLSDLGYTVVSNGWGAAEKDRSNGEQGATDGRTITLNGVTYAKGIGTHANSEITFNLAGQYTQFLSDVGIDDEVGNNGTVVFQVWADGVKLFDSGKMTGSSATQSVDVNLAGKQQLRLVVTNNGDGADFDHADWASARLVAGEPVPVPAPPTGLDATLNGSQVDLVWTDASTDEDGFRVQRKLGANGAWTDIKTLGEDQTSWSDASALAGNSTYHYRVIAFNVGGDSAPSNEDSITTPQGAIEAWVSDLSWASAQNGWGSVEKDRSNGEQGSTDGRQISIRGQKYTKGLGTHGYSKIVYNLAGQYTQFTSDIGVDDETGGNGTVTFEVWVDGALAYNSGRVGGKDAVKQAVVNVAGAQQMWLIVTNNGDGADFDHADWAGAKLTG